MKKIPKTIPEGATVLSAYETDRIRLEPTESESTDVKP